MGKRTNHGREDWGALCCTRRCVAADSTGLSVGWGCVRFFDRVPEPQADVTTDVKLVPWCLRCSNPTYSVVTGESKNAPQRPHTYCSWTLSVGTIWGLRGARSGPSPSLQKRTLRPRGRQRGSLPSRPELEAWSPAPSRSFRAITAASPSHELPSILLVHTWPSVLFVLGCVYSLPQIICKMNLVSTPGTQ